MENPRVSVIIPTYNRPNLIRRSIKSALNQTYKNFEIIVVDDSSTDETFMAVKEFNNKEIKYHRRYRRSGVSSARNFGLEVATGEVIAFLDDDDEWLPNKLIKQINIFRNSSREVGVIHSNCFIMDGNKKFLYHRNSMVDQSLGKLLEFNFIANTTALIKKECFKKVGYFDERITCAEDWDFYIRAAKRFKFAYIPEPLAIIHTDEQNGGEKRLSEDLRKKIRGYQIIIAKHWAEYEKRKKILVKYLNLIGSDLYSLGDAEEGKKYLVEACRNYCYLDFMPVLLLIINLPSFRNIKQNLSTSLMNRILTLSYYPRLKI